MEIKLAILFVDVCESTRLFESAGNVQATQIIQNQLQRVREVVKAHDGRVIKSLGDGLMCTFPTAITALDAASHMLEPLPSGLGPETVMRTNLPMRIGVHFGSVVDSGSDVFGDAVNVAARVEAMARPGETLLTDEIADQLPPSYHARIRQVGTTTVRGKTIPTGIFSFHNAKTADSPEDSTVIGGAPFQPALEHGRALTLSYQGRVVLVTAETPKITIGRHETCTIPVLSRLASRQHCIIEFSRDNFILTDHSSNATFIRVDGAQPVMLRRDMAKLLGSGRLGIGSPPDDEGADEGGEALHVIRFSQ